MMNLTVTANGKTETYSCETRQDIAAVLDQYGLPIRFATGNRVEARGMVAEWSEVKPVADMTEDEIGDEISRMWVESNDGMLPYFGFFGGGPASVKSKNFVRVLLNRHAGKREAEIIRRMLNGLREDNQPIDRCDILPAIKILKAL